MLNVQKEIESLLVSDKPDQLHVSMLRSIKDGAKLTLDEFRKSGRFVGKLNVDLPKNSKLHPDCSEIIVYLCGFYIQVMKDGTFMAIADMDTNESDEIDKWTRTTESLEDAESFLWMNVADKFFNG